MSHIDQNATQAIKECMADIGFAKSIVEGLFANFDQTTTGLAVIVTQAITLQEALNETPEAQPANVANVTGFKERMTRYWKTPEIIITTLQTVLQLDRKTVIQHRAEFAVANLGKVGFWRARFFRYVIGQYTDPVDTPAPTQTETPTAAPTDTAHAPARTFTEAEILQNLARRDALIKEALAGHYLTPWFNLRATWQPHPTIVAALEQTQINGRFMSRAFIYGAQNLQAYISHRRSSLADKGPMHTGFYQWTLKRFYTAYRLAMKDLAKELDKERRQKDERYRQYVDTA